MKKDKFDKIRVNGLEVYRFQMPAINSNMFIVIEEGEALVVDPNINLEAFDLLKENHVQKVMILLTHEHYDHISGVNKFRELFETFVVCGSNCAQFLGDPMRNLAAFWEILVMDKSDELVKEAILVRDDNYSCYADKTLKEIDTIRWRSHQFKIKELAGHSKGSCLIEMDSICLFSGDCLVNGHGIVYKFPGGSWRNIEKKVIPTFNQYDDGTFVFPGHGDPGVLRDMRKYLVKFGDI